MYFSSFEEMRSSFISHSGNTLTLLGSHLPARAVSHCSIPRVFGGKLVEFDSEIVEAIDEISSEGVIEDILRQFYVVV